MRVKADFSRLTVADYISIVDGSSSDVNLLLFTTVEEIDGKSVDTYDVDELPALQYRVLVTALTKALEDELDDPSEPVKVNLDRWKVRDMRHFTNALKKQDFKAVLTLMSAVADTPVTKDSPFTMFTSIRKSIADAMTDQGKTGK